MHLLRIFIFLLAVSFVLRAKGQDITKAECKCAETKAEFDKIGQPEQYRHLFNTLEQLGDGLKAVAVKELLMQKPVKIPNRGKLSGTLEAIVRDSLCLSIIKGDGYTEEDRISLQKFAVVSDSVNSNADFEAYKYILACRAVKILAARHKPVIPVGGFGSQQSQKPQDGNEDDGTSPFVVLVGIFAAIAICGMVAYIDYQRRQIKELRGKVDKGAFSFAEAKVKFQQEYWATQKLINGDPDDGEKPLDVHSPPFNKETDDAELPTDEKGLSDTPPPDKKEDAKPYLTKKERQKADKEAKKRAEQEATQRVEQEKKREIEFEPKRLYAELPNGNILSRISPSLQQEITLLVIKLNKDERSGELNLTDDTLTRQRALLTIDILSDACNLAGTPNRAPTPSNVKVIPGKVELISEGVWRITEKVTLQW